MIRDLYYLGKMSKATFMEALLVRFDFELKIEFL